MVGHVTEVPVLIADAVRTPFGSHDTKLANVHAVDLLATAFTAVVERCGVAPEHIDQVIVGCATPIGEQAVNVGRNAALAAGLAESVPAHTVDAYAASGVMALHEGFARIKAGLSRVCLVGAVSSTRVPDGATSGVAVGKPFGPAVHERFAEAGGLRSPGIVNEHLARRLGMTRQLLDEYAEQSLAAAYAAAESGASKPYLVEVSDGRKIPTFTTGDALRPRQGIPDLMPLFEHDGMLTAATFAVPVSGATALVLVTPELLERPALARIRACASLGGDVLNGSSGSAVAGLVTGGRNKKNIPGVVEVVEDSAVAPLAFRQEAKSGTQVNTEGGALATGDALGVSGLAAVVSVAHRMAEAGDGLCVQAGASGVSTATALEVHN
jgi:acetyl-CoA acyltransferase